MKNAMIVALLMLVGSPFVSADVAELQVINGTPNLDVYVAGKIHGNIGWSAFGVMNDSYATMYAGPTWAPAPWIELGANLGVESGGHRLAETLWIGKGPLSALFIEEQGHTGRWHKYVVDYTLSKKVAIGFHSQAFLGNGGRLSFTHKKVTVWGSLLYREGDFNTVVAIKVSN